MTYQPPQGPYQQQDPYRPQEWPRQLTVQQPTWPGHPQPGQPPGDSTPDAGGPRHPHAQRARPHRVRTILIASAAGLALLLIGAGIGAAGAKTSKPAPAPTVTVTAAAAAAPTVTVTRRAAAAPTVTVTMTATPAAAAPPNPAPSSNPAPASNVLITFSGSGIRNSASFVVNSSAVTAHYSYNCSAFGGSGNFIADLISGSPSSEDYDDQSIANQLGSGGSQTTTVYPQDVGSSYHLEVNSECSWSITLTSG